MTNLASRKELRFRVRRTSFRFLSELQLAACFSSSLSLSSFFDAEKMAAQLASVIWYIFVSDDDDVVSKLEYDNHTNLREDYAAARSFGTLFLTRVCRW